MTGERSFLSGREGQEVTDTGQEAGDRVLGAREHRFNTVDEARDDLLAGLKEHPREARDSAHDG